MLGNTLAEWTTSLLPWRERPTEAKPKPGENSAAQPPALLLTQE